MAVELVLSVVAQDRAGLVRLLAQTIDDHGGSWIDSSMARLRGEFAGILHIKVPDVERQALEDALAGLSVEGIAVVVRHGGADAHKGARAKLELTGIDHPGIVHEISNVLARHNVNFEELHTQVFAGSMTGEPHFAAKSTILIPEGLSADGLREELEDIASDIMVEIDLTDLAEI